MSNQLSLKQDCQSIDLLKKTLFPEATNESVELYIAYCKEVKLDPIMRPAYIVPIKSKVNDKWITKEVIMPGIGLYRIQAHRSGLYAGLSDPEYGPTVKKTFENGVVFEFPEWCRVTVYRIVCGQPFAFHAIERWEENYAKSGYDFDKKKKLNTPNAMWSVRPFGQLAKCAEAQALRKAFPEFVSQQPTYEEMEGKDYIDSDAYSATEVKIENIKPKSLQEFKEKITKKEKTEDNNVVCIEQQETTKNLSDSVASDDNASPEISDGKSAILSDIAEMLSYYEYEVRLGLEKALLKKLQVSHFREATEDKLEKAYRWLVDRWTEGADKQEVKNND